MLILILIVLGLVFLFIGAVAVLAATDAELAKKLNVLLRSMLTHDAPHEMQIVRKGNRSAYEPERMTEVNMTRNNEGPPDWNEEFIAEHLRTNRDNPPVVKHFIHSIITRFIVGQDSQTINKRQKFLESQISGLKIMREYLTARDDIALHELERDIRERKLNLEKEDLENKKTAQRELDNLILDKDKLKIKLEITQLSKQIREVDDLS